MVINMMENGKIIKNMGKAPFTMKMENFILVNGIESLLNLTYA